MNRPNHTRVSRLFSIARGLPTLCLLGLSLDAAVALSAQPSHIGQKISDHVTVRMSRTGNEGVCGDFAERIFANGNRGSFQLSGRWFVVTDVTWRTVVGPGFPSQEPGLVTLRIFLGEGEPAIFESSARVSADNVSDPVFGSEHLTTGFVVDAIPCFEFEQSESEEGVGGLIILHGYLIDRPPIRGN